MTEKEAIERIHSVYPTGCKNGLENMRALMGRLGNPQEKLTMVHVAGTNGKGSCCAMIERVLRAAAKSRWPLRDFSGHAGFPKFNRLKSARVILIRS